MATPKPVFDPWRATAVANMRLANMRYRHPITRELLHQSADCFLGVCRERRTVDIAIGSAGRVMTCKGCGLLKADWNMTHQLYRPWSDQCPSCVSDYIAEDADYKRRQDV